ncbi:MAG TPA: hypothetical protein DET40_21315 [Lentisphaeria bacterium]|nr:MAG: hypothetical protein A2X45_03225 [Lentisphaerae bacterium GWF2_50_93]HCE46092.1 hypothetical protein [Lentisphaeria bacterium]
MLFRNLVLILSLLFSLPSFSQETTPDRPPVIAMTAIANFTYPKESHDIMAIRDKVVSDLVRNYECVVISRSNGFAMVTENTLGKISAVRDGTAQTVNNIPAADFAITGYFKVTKREPKWATLGCTLLITDLHEKSKADFRKAEFVPNEDTNFSPEITAKIVDMLKLKPKKKFEPVNEVLNETWAILPVSHLETLKQMEQSADRSLAMSMELALQESRKVKRIVDHNEIDKVLQELKISSLSGATESLAGNIAGIVGADRVVMCTVSRASRKNDNIRADLLLVDGKTAEVLDSVSAICKKDELEKTSSLLIVQLAQQRSIAHPHGTATKEMRAKEYELYKEIIHNMENGWSDIDFVLSQTEAAYMLVPDDPAKLFEIAAILHDNCLRMSWQQDMYDIYGKVLKYPKTKMIVNTIDKLLQPESLFLKTQYPLIIRADSHCLAGDFDTALNLINMHISQYPDTERAYASYVQGTIYYSKKEYQKAEACLAGYPPNKSDSKLNQLGVSLGLHLYKILGNDKKELGYLKIQRSYYWDVLRCLQLIKKLEGPKAVIEYSERRPLYSYETDRPEVQLELAKVYLELGNREKAAEILRNANSDAMFKVRGSKCYDNPEYAKKVKDEIQELNKQLGASRVEWKKASQIAGIPDRYKIYIQPIGMTDLSIFTNAVPRIEEFWGTRVNILPVLPMPEDPLSFVKEKGQYNSRLIVDRLHQAWKEPDDSIYTFYATDRDTFMDFEFIKKAHKEKKQTKWALSVSKTKADKFDYDFITQWICRDLAGIWRSNKNKTVEDYKSKPYFGDCVDYSCCISILGNPQDKNFALCESCQKKLKNVKFDELYGFWQKMIKLDAITDPEEKKWVEEYRIKVQEALKKADEEKAMKSKEKNDFLPSVEVADAKPGIFCDYYEFENDKVKNSNQLTELQPQKSMIAPALSTDSIERKENFGVVFSGFIKVPADDVYTFYLSSDDGSTLTINDSKIIDNDGMHAPETKTGSVALKAGFHPIRLAYIQGTKDKLLEIYWRSEKHLLGQKITDKVIFTNNASTSRMP